MSKIIIELKVIEVKTVGEPPKYANQPAQEQHVEENKIKLEVDSFDKAEAKVIAFFKMLGI